MGKIGGNLARRVTSISICCAAVIGTSLTTITPATAATPCKAGTPVAYDVNGDGTPELDRAWRPDRVTADLNGDLCADQIAVNGYGVASWILGSTNGLDYDTDSNFTFERPAGVPASYEASGMVYSMLNSGKGQIISVVRFSRRESVTKLVLEPKFDTLAVATLTETGKVESTQYVSLAGKIGAREPSVAAADGLIAIGDPSNNRVLVLTSDSSGKISFTRTITQNSKGVPGTTEKADAFGAAVALRDRYLAIGAPGEAIGNIRGAGAVQPLKLSSTGKSYTAYRAIDQGTKGVPGKNETKDGFGSSLVIGTGLTATDSYDILIGTPGENVSSVVNAGAATVANFTKPLYRTYTKASTNIPGDLTAQDRFGKAVQIFNASNGTESAVISTHARGGCSIYSPWNLPMVYSDPGKLTDTTKWTALDLCWDE